MMTLLRPEFTIMQITQQLLIVGEKERGVREDFIKPLPEQGCQSTSIFRLGDKIKARYCGEIPSYPGTIASVNSNGTYDVDYEDGDTWERARENGGGKRRSFVVPKILQICRDLCLLLCLSLDPH